MLHVIVESGGDVTDGPVNLRTVAAPPLAEMLPRGPDGEALALSPLRLATCCATSTYCCKTHSSLRLCLAGIGNLEVRDDVLCNDGALQNQNAGHQARCQRFYCQSGVAVLWLAAAVAWPDGCQASRCMSSRRAARVGQLTCTLAQQLCPWQPQEQRSMCSPVPRAPAAMPCIHHSTTPCWR